MSPVSALMSYDLTVYDPPATIFCDGSRLTLAHCPDKAMYSQSCRVRRCRRAKDASHCEKGPRVLAVAASACWAVGSSKPTRPHVTPRVHVLRPPDRIASGRSPDS